MKGKLVVKHNHIEVNDYNLGDCPTLEGLFSIWDKLTHNKYMKILEYIEDENKIIVPRGVDVDYIAKILECKPEVDYNHDPFDIVGDIKLKFLPRDNVQKEALAFMQGVRGYTSNKKKSQLSLNLNTGKGKTYCAITNTSASLYRSIIITSSIDWLNQWKSCILEYTDTLPSEIYMIIGSASIKRLLTKDMSQYKFILASHDTIKSYGDRNGWRSITELFKYMRVGYKYYDEAHLNFYNMARIDSYTNTYRTYYITATPARSDSDEDVLFGYYFKNIPSINLFDEDEDPHTHYVAIKYNSRPSPLDISKCRNPYGFDKNAYSGYVVTQPNYYKILHVLIGMALKNGMKNIFYIATNDAIDITYNWIINNYPDIANDVGIFNSRVPKDKKDAVLEKRIILSTTKSLGTAQDIKGLKMVVVLAEPFRSKVLAKQTLGRTRDKDTYYIEVVDTGFKPITSYFNDKKEIYSKYALSVSVVDMKDDILDEKYNRILDSRKHIGFRVPITFIEKRVPIRFNN